MQCLVVVFFSPFQISFPFLYGLPTETLQYVVYQKIFATIQTQHPFIPIRWSFSLCCIDSCGTRLATPLLLPFLLQTKIEYTWSRLTVWVLSFFHITYLILFFIVNGTNCNKTNLFWNIQRFLVPFCCELPQKIIESNYKDKLKLMADLSFTPSLPKDEDFDCYSSISDRQNLITV